MTLLEAWRAFLATRGTCRVDAAGHISVRSAETGETNLLADDVRERLEAAGFGMGGAEWRDFVNETLLDRPSTTSERPTDEAEQKPRSKESIIDDIF